MGGDPRRVMTISDFAAAAELGVRSNIKEGGTPRYDVLARARRVRRQRQVRYPGAKTFPLADWRAALKISQAGHARGELVLLPDSRVTN